MIIRVFRGCVKPERLSTLQQVLAEVTVPLVRGREGLVSYYVGTPMETNPDEFLVVTVWSSLDALRKFAGERWQDKVIPARMAEYLRDSFLYHYSAFEPPSTPAPGFS